MQKLHVGKLVFKGKMWKFLSLGIYHLTFILDLGAVNARTILKYDKENCIVSR